VKRAELATLGFPHERLAEALDAAVVAAGIERGRPPAAPLAVPPVAQAGRVAEFLDRVGARLGVDVEPVEVAGGELAAALTLLGPGLVALPGGSWLAVVGGRRGRLQVIDPTLARHDVPVSALVAELTAAAVAPAEAEAAQVIQAAALRGRRAARARHALAAGYIARARVDGLWMCRLPPGRPFGEQLRRAGLMRRAALLLGLHLAVSILWLAAWYLVGRVALGGGAAGWLVAWALCLASLLPIRALVGWLQGVLALDLGALLRRRLLAGALSLDPDRTKRDGLGRLLGLVLECEALESLGTSGGAQVLLAAVELLPVPIALALGAGGWPHAALLVAWLVPVAVVGRRQLAVRARWTASRLELSHRLVENLVGHRTRLVQLPAERWHLGEDRALADYHGVSARYDRARLALLHLLARGWMVIGLAALVPALSGGAGAGALAISVGGVLYAFAALERLAGGMGELTAALDGWRRVEPIYRAAADGAAAVTAPVAVVERPTPPDGAPLLEAHNLGFGHVGRAPLFDDLSLTIKVGDRVLLEGSSGAGKSTLAALLAAQRRPGRGLVLLDQLDVDTVTVERWRRRVALVPQFHENHVMSDTFLFNLLMARAWPPAERDVKEAEAVCQALGLDRVLAAMPAGLLQVVGDTGWQLSHGEKSRLFLARALLQQADLVILDESLAALDPELLAQVGGAVLERARTLVVIAHP
jgi:ATP-binding cassette, subfamily B, bacterial